MAGAGKTVFRVMRVLGHDVAVICEVRDGDTNGGRIRETKDPRIILGGVDSFWLVTGEKKEQKLFIERNTPPFRSVSPLTAPLHSSSLLNLTANLDLGSPGRHDAVSFATATKLPVAYSPRDISPEELVARLRNATLSIPSEKDVDAIEIRPGSWLTQFKRNSSGYGLSKNTTARSVPVATLENRPETVRLSSGLVIYVTQPRWTPSEAVDLRTEHEMLEAAEYWLARATSADVQSGSDAGLLDLLRQYTASTVDDEEQADLSAVIELLSSRQPLVDLVSQMMARQPGFQEKLREFEQSEKNRLRASLQSRLEEEMQSERSRLSDIRAELADTETKLALATYREGLLRSEAEKHDDSIRARIAEAASDLAGKASREGQQLREEVDRLRDMISQTTTPAVHVAPSDPLLEGAMEEDTPVQVVIATDEVRKNVIAGLSCATAMSVADVVSIILRSTEDVPVLIGRRSSAAAADMAAALGGNDSAIAFCDPSRVSWQDLLRDETSGLAAAIAKARNHPEVLVPVALCGITNGPCEYWVPQFIESRRFGKLPRNLAVIASAGIDGMRVSVPDSVLEYFVPVLVPASSRPARNLFAGAWRADLEVDRAKLVEALELLSKSDGLEKAALQRAARILSRTPAGIDMDEVAAALLRHNEWLSSLSGEGQQHEFKNYFKNIGG